LLRFHFLASFRFVCFVCICSYSGFVLFWLFIYLLLLLSAPFCFCFGFGFAFDYELGSVLKWN
jgi:hypothetical protein